MNGIKNLNDSFILNIGSYEWRNPVSGDMVSAQHHDEEDNKLNESQDNIGTVFEGEILPHPRANTASCFVDGKVYIFGGHGGLGYQRVAFNDLWSFDIKSGVWERIHYTNNPCEPRGGHCIFAIGTNIYIYGGWNLETQYNTIAMFDIEKKEWSDPDIYHGLQRWNFCAVMVEAIPSWKYFIFGGEQGDFPEGGPRKFGTFVNSSCVLDIDTMSWMNIQTEDEDTEGGPYQPSEREYASMVYDSKNYRLIVFGGWANEWLSDVHALNVSSIVGPPYAITEIIPSLGQLTGGNIITIHGVGFKDTSEIKVRFSHGKQFCDVIGTYVTETEMTCVTPNFEAIGPKECEVRMNIQGGDFTNTWCNFNFFMNTREYKCLAYGPGLLEGSACGSPTEFIIQARNDHDENRRSGRDHFEVKITAIGEGPKQIETKIEDNDDGTYLVSYQVEDPSEVKIEITFENEKQKMVPIRGSPYSASFSDKSPANNNQLLGAAMAKYISSSLEQIGDFISTTSKGINLKDKDIENDVKQLIAVKEHVESVTSRNEEMIFWLDCVDESLKLFHKHDKAKDSQLKAIRKAFDNWAHLKKQAKE